MWKKECIHRKKITKPLPFIFDRLLAYTLDDMKVHPQKCVRMSFMYNPKIITRKSCSTKRMNGRSRDLICKSTKMSIHLQHHQRVSLVIESIFGLITREEKLIMSTAVSMSTTLFERVIQLFVV